MLGFGKLAMSAEWRQPLGPFPVGKVRCTYPDEQRDWTRCFTSGALQLGLGEAGDNRVHVQVLGLNSIGPAGTAEQPRLSGCSDVFYLRLRAGGWFKGIVYSLAVSAVRSFLLLGSFFSRV